MGCWARSLEGAQTCKWKQPQAAPLLFWGSDPQHPAAVRGNAEAWALPATIAIPTRKLQGVFYKELLIGCDFCRSVSVLSLQRKGRPLPLRQLMLGKRVAAAAADLLCAMGKIPFSSLQACSEYKTQHQQDRAVRLPCRMRPFGCSPHAQDLAGTLVIRTCCSPVNQCKVPSQTVLQLC